MCCSSAIEKLVTPRVIGWFAVIVRRFQSGYIYHYAFTMIIGVLLLLTLIVLQRV